MRTVVVRKSIRNLHLHCSDVRKLSVQHLLKKVSHLEVSCVTRIGQVVNCKRVQRTFVEQLRVIVARTFKQNMLTESGCVHRDNEITFRCKLAEPKTLVDLLETCPHVHSLRYISILACLRNIRLVFRRENIIVSKRIQENGCLRYFVSYKFSDESLA